jgi:hypothetical protein
MLTAMRSASPGPADTLLPAPVKVAMGGPDFVGVLVTLTIVVGAAVGTATAATVLSSAGVVLYFMLSSPKDTVVSNGSAETREAPG